MQHNEFKSMFLWCWDALNARRALQQSSDNGFRNQMHKLCVYVWTISINIWSLKRFAIPPGVGRITRATFTKGNGVGEGWGARPNSWHDARQRSLSWSALKACLGHEPIWNLGRSGPIVLLRFRPQGTRVPLHFRPGWARICFVLEVWICLDFIYILGCRGP